MFKKLLLSGLALFIAGTLAFSLPTNTYAQEANGRGRPSGSGGGYVAAPSGTLTAAEQAALLYMYEEEQLARDVYNTLATKWGVAEFQNIAKAEQNHMSAVANLLTRYGIAVPNNAAGKFNNPELQKLYTELVAQGNGSISAALQVGVQIEKLDIADLQTRLAQTTRADIQQVFNNLVRGSQQHERAFTAAQQFYKP